MAIERVLIEIRLSKENLRKAVAAALTVDPARVDVYGAADDEDTERLELSEDCILSCELEYVPEGDFQTLVYFDLTDENRLPELAEIQQLCALLGCRGLVEAGFTSEDLGAAHLMIQPTGECQPAVLDSVGDLDAIRIGAVKDGLAELEYVGDNRGKLERFTDFSEKWFTLPLIRKVLATCAFMLGALIACILTGSLNDPKGVNAIPAVIGGTVCSLIVAYCIRSRN